MAMEEDIVGGSSFFYSFGASLLFVFALQAITGVFQMFYYVPTTDYAYNSINYLRISVPFGWLIHGLHYWGAQAMVVIVVVHMTRVFIWGAYKKPRELTWLLGAGLFAAVMAMVFTGALLPWDEKGYNAAEVGTSIAGTVPWIGDFIKRVMRGGESMGQLTLSRFFITHIAIIPGLLAGLAGLHVVAFRNNGSVGPWSEEKRKRSGKFWPEQVSKDTIIVTLLLMILVTLVVFAPAPITGPADPIDTSYNPKPEWNFLSLYQALKIFKGSWEPVGTIGLPLVTALILLLVPFVDRRDERHPFRRPIAMLFMIVVAAFVITLTITGALSNPAASAAKLSGGNKSPTSTASKPAASPAKDTTQATDTASASSKADSTGNNAASTQAAGPPATTAQIQEGKHLVDSLGCRACHTIAGSGGKVGPSLAGESSRGHDVQWIVAQIKNPKAHDPTTVMPAFSGLTAQHYRDVARYILSLKGSASAGTTSSPAKKEIVGAHGRPGPAAYIIGNAEHGAILFKQQCQHCHGVDAKGGQPNPGSNDGTIPPLNPIDPHIYNKDPQTFAENVDIRVQNGAIPRGPNPQFHMPDFGKSHSMTQQEIAEVITYVLSLNGVKRAEIQHPGIKPHLFWWISMAAFALVIVMVGSLAMKARSDK